MGDMLRFLIFFFICLLVNLWDIVPFATVFTLSCKAGSVLFLSHTLISLNTAHIWFFSPSYFIGISGKEIFPNQAIPL